MTALPASFFAPHPRAWYERRLSGWGGSEAAAVIGISRWSTQRSVVEQKARRIIPDPDAPERLRLRLGRELEPVLREHLWEVLVERFGTAPRPRASTRLHRMPRHPFVIANVDGFVGEPVMELKTDEYGFEPWGDEEADWHRSVPPYYAVQCQHNLAATGRSLAYLFVLIGLHEERLYLVERDDAYIADLVELEAEQWARVEAIRERLADDQDAEIGDLLPAIDGSAASAAYLRRRYPTDNGLIPPASSEQEEKIVALREARAARRRAEAVETAAENVIKAIIGEASGISSGAGTVTWKLTAPAVHVDHESIARDFRALLERVMDRDPDVVPAILAERGLDLAGRSAAETLDLLAGLHTSTTPGSRPFVVPWRAWDRMAG